MIERPSAKKRVQFVFMRNGESQHAQVRAQGMLATASDGMGATSSNCRHLRVSLPVEEKGGESAVITATLQLPSIETEPKKPEAEPEEKKAKPVAAKPVSRRGPRMMGMTTATPPSSMEEREIRLRELQANISVSKSTKDKEPLVSVSFGWSNRETTQRVFDSGE